MTTKSAKSSENYFERAGELLKQKSYKEAAANYLNASFIAREDAQSYFGLGMCYRGMLRQAA